MPFSFFFCTSFFFLEGPLLAFSSPSCFFKLHAETNDFTFYSCCAPQNVWKGCSSVTPFSSQSVFSSYHATQACCYFGLYFLASTTLQGSTAVQEMEQTPDCSCKETHIACSVRDQSDAEGVHVNFTAKFSRSMGAPFCFFCELMTCLYFAHPGEHAYKCSSCSFSTMTISQLKEHSLKVHGKALTLPRPRIVNLAASHAHHTSKNHTPAEEVEDSNGKRCLRARI